MKKGLAAGDENLRGRTHYIEQIARAEHLAHRFEASLKFLEQFADNLSPKALLVRTASLARLGRLSNKETNKNRTSRIRINASRIDSEIERRQDLDFWVASLQMPGFST